MMRSDSMPFVFVGNAPWIDFVNTEVVIQGEPRDLLEGPEDLAAWLRDAGLADEGGSPGVDGRTVELAFEEALHLRRRLRELAVASAQGRDDPLESVEAVNEVLAATPVVDVLVSREGGWVRRRRPMTHEPASLLLPVAVSAAEFLETGERSYLRQCGAPDCILFFYDTTKNHGRRWCSMAGCGNRAKAAAFQRRKRR